MSERFEPTDLSSRLVARAGAYLALTIALIFVAIYGFLHLLTGGTPVLRQTAPWPETAQWGEPVPASYRWLDREKKIISIPIDRAIDLTAERGLPARPKP